MLMKEDQLSELAPRADLRRQPSQGEAEVADSGGRSVGGLILFARDGYLSCLEIWGDPARCRDRITFDLSSVLIDPVISTSGEQRAQNNTNVEHLS